MGGKQKQSFSYLNFKSKFLDSKPNEFKSNTINVTFCFMGPNLANN